MIDEKLQKKVDSLSEKERDDIYRYLWAEHVKADIEEYAEDNDITLDEEDVEAIANRYVYDGKYDCNLDYWTNIGKLIEQCQRDNNL